MKKVILGLLGAIFTLIIVAVIALKVMFPAEKIKAMVIPEIEKVLGREVQVADAGINIFPTLGVSLEGLKIANTSDTTFTQAEMLELGEFRVDLAVMPLFAGQVKVQNILIDALTLRVEANLAGTFNFADLKVLEKDSTVKEEVKSTEPFELPQLPIPLTLESFELRNMKVEFKDQKAGRNIRIGAINQKVALSIDQNLEDIKTTGSLTIADISVQTKEVPFKLSDITLRSTHDLALDLKKGNLTINKITGGLQKIGISLKGDVNNFLAEPTFNLEVNSDKIFFQDLLNEIPKSLSPEINNVKAKGYTLFSVLAKGSAEKPTVTGSLSVKQGRFQYADFPKALEALNLESDFSLNHFNLKNLSLELGKGNPVKVSALIKNFVAPLLNINIDTKIDLATLKELVELPEGTDFGGKILTDIKINGQVDPANIENASKTVKVAGQVALQKIYAKTPQLKVPVNIDGNVDFSSQYLAPKVKVLLGESNIDFDGKLQDFLSFVIANDKAPTPSFDFKVSSKKLLIDKIIVVPEGEKVEEEKTAGPPIVLLAAPLPLIDITADIAFNKVAYGAIDIKKLNTLLTLKNGLLDLNTTALLFGGNLSNKLHLNAAGAPTVSVNIKTDVNSIRAENMLKAVTQELGNQKPIFAQIKKLDGSLSGNLSFNSDFTTQGITDQQVIEALKGDFRASVLKGVLKPGPVLKALGSSFSKYIEGFDAPIAFDNLVLKGRVEEEKLHIDEMDMKSSKLGQIIVDGTIGFDNSINLVIGDKLPASRSRVILRQQEKLVSGAKDGASKLTKGLGSQVSGAITGLAGNVIDNNKIPSDKDGRITPEVDVTGTLLDPSVSGFRFSSKDAVEGKKEDSPSVQHDLKNQLNAKKKELEAKAKAELAKQKAAALAKANKVKADAMKKANAKKAQLAKAKKEAEAKARAKAAKAKKDAEKKAADKLKSLF